MAEVVPNDVKPAYSPYRPGAAKHLTEWQFKPGPDHRRATGQTGPTLTPRLREYADWLSSDLEALDPRRLTAAERTARELWIRSWDQERGDKARDQVFNRLDGPMQLPERPANTAFESLQLALVAAYIDRMQASGLSLPAPPIDSVDSVATPTDPPLHTGDADHAADASS